MINRIKKVWELSKINFDEESDVLTLGDIKKAQESLGDGKAEFLGEGTVDEYKRMQEEDKGFVKRVFGL